MAMPPPAIALPAPHRFAVAILDDTDLSTLANTEPVYELLAELGIRSTKSVWPLRSVAGERIGGMSLQDPAYAEFVRRLQADGFEISLHGVRNASSTRQDVVKGLEVYEAEVGSAPRVHANHSNNRENLYWGGERLSLPWMRFAYHALTRFRRWGAFRGTDPESPHFWGDLSRARLDYVRNLTFSEINLLRINPTLPYEDPRRPFVRFWFSSSDGADVDTFCRLMSEANQERLEAEGGVTIVYTHFASGFVEHGELNRDFVRLMRRLSTRPGWFVPVSPLLDHLVALRTEHVIPRAELHAMERRWLADRVRTALG